MKLIERFIENQISRYGLVRIIISLILAFTLLILLMYWLKNPVCDLLRDFELCSLLSNELRLISGFILSIIYVLLVFFAALFLDFVWQHIRPKSRETTLLPDISKWIYQGHLKIENELEITASNSGVLMSSLYKDFEMSFKLKIINGGGVGVVFRAQDLENYLMLQISLGDNQKTNKTEVFITPHIRFLGNFETFNLPNIYGESYYRADLNCTNNELLVNLRVCDYIAELRLTASERSETFLWNIPTHTEPNIIQRYPKEQSSMPEDRFTARLWFRKRYGKIGFRAFNLEKARISDLRIKEL